MRLCATAKTIDTNKTSLFVFLGRFFRAPCGFHFLRFIIRETYILADILPLWVIENQRFPTPQIHPLVRAFQEEKYVCFWVNICSGFPHFNKHARISYANGCSDYLRRLTPCFRGKPLCNSVTSYLSTSVLWYICQQPTDPKNSKYPHPIRCLLSSALFVKRKCQTA